MQGSCVKYHIIKFSSQLIYVSPITLWLRFMKPYVTSSGAEMGIFLTNYLNTIATNALAPCTTRPAASMVLAMQDKHVLIFHKEVFLQPDPSQC